MKRRITKLTFIALVGAIATASAFYAKSLLAGVGSTSGSPHRESRGERTAEAIEGRVIGVEGELIAGARVHAEETGPIKSLVLSGVSDEEGNFRIDLPAPGVYQISGSKVEDGYASSTSGFHQETDARNPPVTVSENQVVRDVVLQFFSKSLKLEGTITDSRTSQPVGKATITLRRADNPELAYIVGANPEKATGKFRVLVPSLPFTIEISSPEYETWTYSEDGLGNHADPLSVERGEKKSLRVRMHPKKKAP